MENKEKNNFYAVLLIGGILCIYSILGNNLFTILLHIPESVSFNPPGFTFSVLIIGFGPIILNLVLGILMIVSAVKMKNGKTTLFEEKKKLLIFSWLVVSVSLVLSIFSIFAYGTFFFLHEPGLVGGLIIILGNFFYTLVTKRNFIYGPPLIQEGENIEPSPTKEQDFYANPKFCTNCGFNLEEKPFKFCPNCGTQLTSE